MAEGARTLAGYARGMVDRGKQVSPSDLAISVIVLMNFAVAQPLLDVLGRHGTFFTAHDMGAREVVLFAILVTLVVPLLLAILIAGLHLVHRQTARVIHLAVTVGLWLAIVLPVADRVVPGSTALVLLAAGLAALLVTAVYFVAQPVRLFVRFGLIAPPAILLFFLAVSPASGIVKGGTPQTVGNVSFDHPAPVVVVVLDEFPLASIIDRQGGVDAGLFPNLARLADSSTWYRGAETVSGVTDRAVPALLSGDDPGEAARELLPIGSDYPTNLFTVLGGAYDIVSIEEVSQLCPDDVCRDPAEGRQRIGRMTTVSDVATVYMHVVLPEGLRSRLPVIDDRWVGFTTGDPDAQDPPSEEPDLTEDGLRKRLREAIRGDAVASFEAFIDSIEPTPSPTAWFGHFMLPHSPWEFLPFGARYEAEPEPQPGRAPERGAWGPDEWLVTHAYQRHLLQVGLLDRLVGRLLDRLESTSLYDETLLVIASDHGISFLPDNRRRLTPETIGGVKHVPLFVKLPGQTAPRWSDEQVLITDILPTILDALGGDIAWEGSGRSLLGDQADADSPGPLPAALQETVERKHGLFPLEDGWLGVHRYGPFGELVGTPASASRVRQQDGDLRVDVWHRELYEDVEVDSSFVPALARGVLAGSGDLEEPRFLAFSLNGTIAAIGRTYANDEHPANFMTTLWPEAFVDGRNDLEVHLVDQEDGAPVLTPVSIE